MKVTIDEKKKTMTVEIELQEPRSSRSGKTKVIATTNGNSPAGVEYKGKPVVIGLNAYYKE